MRDEIGHALGIDIFTEVVGNEHLPSCFAVSDLMSASVAAVGSAASSLIEAVGLAPSPPAVRVDQRLVSLWSGRSIHPVGWEMPPVWDAVAGDYRTRDGWIKLHTNLPHHRRAALAVLGTEPDRGLVALAVAEWGAEALETAIVAAGGVAAAMRCRDEWARHPQGAAVASEPLIAWNAERSGSIRSWGGTRDRPLAGLRVLDLTRVIAGPVATRTLAGLGATVLRIDPPDWEEPNVVPEVTLGKRCAHLRLDTRDGRTALEDLLADADVLVHGYRPGALDGLGLGEETRRRLNPNLIEVALNAYGWTGPWAGRRGFDSLVQMSCGIAEAGMIWAGRAEPTPLPVQALDHATGYFMAAAALTALDKGTRGNGISSARLSLARTGDLLARHHSTSVGTLGLQPESADVSPIIERTPWGDARRLRSPLSIEGTTVAWDISAGKLGAAPATWSNVRIAVAQSNNLDDVARVWHDSALQMDGASVDTPSSLELRGRLDVELRNGWVLYVALRSDRIVGMLAIKPAEAVLDQVFVLPDEQAKGVGRQLLDKAKSMMANGFTLRMSTANLQARRFYERQGLQLDREGVHPRSGAPVLHYRWGSS